MAKYWKQGFYDEPQEGSVEITEEYWQELLDGQSSGKEIRENESGYPVLVDHEYTLDELKEMKIADINAYDKSDAVNSFTLSGKRMWLTKEDRVGLVNSINIEKQAGRLDTVLWFDAVKYTTGVQTCALSHIVHRFHEDLFRFLLDSILVAFVLYQIFRFDAGFDGKTRHIQRSE